MNRRRWVSLFLRLGLGLALALSGWMKLGDPAAFAGLVAHYRLLPASLNQILGVSLPWVELLTGLLLILGILVRPSAWAAATLLLAFVGASGSALWRGLRIDCGCLGPSMDLRLTPGTLAVEALLLLVALYLARYGEENRAPNPSELSVPKVGAQ